MQGHLVGAATRYIAGRNAVQTVYWRGCNSSDSQKFMKVARTVQFAKPRNAKIEPPARYTQERHIRV